MHRLDEVNHLPSICQVALAILLSLYPTAALADDWVDGEIEEFVTVNGMLLPVKPKSAVGFPSPVINDALQRPIDQDEAPSLLAPMPVSPTSLSRAGSLTAPEPFDPLADDREDASDPQAPYPAPIPPSPRISKPLPPIPWLDALGRGTKALARGTMDTAAGAANTGARILSSPEFWAVAGTGAAIYGAYQLDRSQQRRLRREEERRQQQALLFPGLGGPAPGLYPGALPPAMYYPPGYRAFSSGYVNPNHHWVDPYIRRNGVAVSGHYRTNHNSTMYDNYSSLGNINPFTGQWGTVVPRY